VLELLPAGLAVLTASVAVYTDVWRDRIIPDALTLPMIAVGISFHLLLGLWERDPYLALSGVLGASLAFSLSYLLWYLGGWAGGDVKLLTAFGALLPIHSPPSSIPPYSDLPLFPLTILFNTVLLTLPLLAVYALLCFLRGRNPFYEKVRITEVREGMIPAEYIYEREGKILREEALLGMKPSPPGERIFTHPRRASGLTRSQIRVLRKLVAEGRLENRLKVKKGMPFAPSLAAGLLSALLYGDLYWALILGLRGVL
jgi:prepilin signal peptidase PulO-like enzyme (type II secretory pathway)